MTPAERLHAGIAALGISLPDGTQSRLLVYLDLLTKWNRTYNLTAVRDPATMVTHHVLDSLALLPLLASWLQRPSGCRLADIGSGAGIPGLVLAIAQPGLEVASIEASQKKAAFQRQVKIELGLAGTSILCARAEAVTATFDIVLSRAFASLADFIRHGGHLSSTLLAMKGAFPAAEIAALPAGWCLSASHEMKIPGLDAQRHLLVLEKV